MTEWSSCFRMLEKYGRVITVYAEHDVIYVDLQRTDFIMSEGDFNYLKQNGFRQTEKGAFEKYV